MFSIINFFQLIWKNLFCSSFRSQFVVVVLISSSIISSSFAFASYQLLFRVDNQLLLLYDINIFQKRWKFFLLFRRFSAFDVLFSFRHFFDITSSITHLSKTTCFHTINEINKTFFDYFISRIFSWFFSFFIVYFIFLSLFDYYFSFVKDFSLYEYHE